MYGVHKALMNALDAAPAYVGGAGLDVARVDTIGQLVQKTEDDLLAITNFGSKSLEEVIEKLDERGLSLRVKE